MTTPNYEPLWYWIRARENIRVSKDAGDHPLMWTADRILYTYRFCNVRREDDRGTVWIRENIRKPFSTWELLWFMLCVARQINWPATLEELISTGAWPLGPDFDPAEMTAALNARKARGDKVYTGAYMISAPSEKGADKQSYICETVLGALWRERGEFRKYFFNGKPTLQGTHQRLTAFNGWGQFMAYQAVVDMRFTALLDKAPDIETWAAAGPGTIRGLNRIYGRSLAYPLSQGQALDEMRKIYALATRETGVEMDFSDVPNTLCETDKYLRVKNGEGKPRALYVVGRGH